jgi:hypothetical protein
MPITPRGILLLIAGCLIAIIILSLPNLDINYSVKIYQPELPQGQDLFLVYTINNGIADVHGLSIISYVTQGDLIVINKNTTQLGTLYAFKSIESNLIIKTSTLQPGKYTVWVDMEYTKGTGNEARIFGKRLSLPITIY